MAAFMQETFLPSQHLSTLTGVISLTSRQKFVVDLQRFDVFQSFSSTEDKFNINLYIIPTSKHKYFHSFKDNQKQAECELQKCSCCFLTFAKIPFAGPLGVSF